MKKDYTKKQWNGSDRMKSVPTPKRDFKVEPETVRAFNKSYKVINDQNKKNFGHVSYRFKDIHSNLKAFIRNSKKRIFV